MTDQPTDHREQADHWLGEAADAWDSGDDTGQASSAALVGIGHALLALTDTPARYPYATPKTVGPTPEPYEMPNGGSDVPVGGLCTVCDRTGPLRYIRHPSGRVIRACVDTQGCADAYVRRLEGPDIDLDCILNHQHGQGDCQYPGAPPVSVSEG